MQPAEPVNRAGCAIQFHNGIGAEFITCCTEGTNDPKNLGGMARAKGCSRMKTHFLKHPIRRKTVGWKQVLQALHRIFDTSPFVKLEPSLGVARRAGWVA